MTTSGSRSDGKNVADEIEKSICGVNEFSKQSIMSLRHTGLMPNNENAITKCPSNFDQLCLNLRNNDDTESKYKHISCGGVN